MNIEEAIEFMQETFNMYKNDAQNNFVEMHKCNETIYLLQQLNKKLQRGEKFEQMWEHISVIYEGHGTESDIKALEQKYFPNDNIKSTKSP